METGSLTEFEENLTFDWDDPDFDHSGAKEQNLFSQMNILKTGSSSQFYQMSTSIQSSSGTLSRHGSNISLSGVSASLSDDGQTNVSHPQYQETMLTIEQIRAYYNTCFTCGVSWSEQQVSLDCRECDGFASTRPCPICSGRCHEVWQRDYTASHSKHQARWIGKCGLSCGPSIEESLTPALEKLRATS